MKNMKRLIAVMLVLTMALCLVACGGQNDTPTTTQKPNSTNKPTTQPTTQPTTAPTEPAKPSHTVKVVDQDGNPVSNIPIQLCDNNACYDAKPTDENGIVEFFLPGIEKAKARILPLGSNPIYPINRQDYTIDANENADADGYILFGENTEIVLTVTKVAE
jgi:hypothetical protein